MDLNIDFETEAVLKQLAKFDKSRWFAVVMLRGSDSNLLDAGTRRVIIEKLQKCGVINFNGTIDYTNGECILLEKGYNIFNEGGWLKYIEQLKKKAEIDAKIEKAKNSSVINQAYMHTWQRKFFWPITLVGFFGGLFGIAAFFWKLYEYYHPVSK